MRVYSNGTVLWLQEMTFGSYCSLHSNVEEKSCVIVLQTSANDASEVTFKVLSNGNANFNITDSFKEWKASKFASNVKLRQEPISGLYFYELLYAFQIDNQMTYSDGQSFTKLFNITIYCLCLLITNVTLRITSG